MECIKGLNSKMDSLSEEKEEEKIEERFKGVKMGIPLIKNPNSEKGRKQIQKWLGELARKVFSRGFRLFKEE